MKFIAEVTDTYGGEANYGWVRRFEFDADPATSDRELVRKAKKGLGYTGTRCNRTTYGDTIQLNVVGACIRMFISPKQE